MISQAEVAGSLQRLLDILVYIIAGVGW